MSKCTFFCLLFAAVLGASAEIPADAAPGHYGRSSWASVHADSRNSDFAAVHTPTRLYAKWSVLTGATLINPGTVGLDGTHYVSSGRGPGTSHLHAFDRNGKLLWEASPQTTGDDLDSMAGFNAPVIDEAGDIYIGDGNQMWAFRPDGRVKWVSPLPNGGEPFVYQIITKAGRVGGITVGGDVVLYDRASGELAVPVFALPEGVPPEQGPELPGLWGGGLLDPDVVGLFKRIAFGFGVEVANAPAVHPRTGRIFITAAGPLVDGELSGVLYGLDETSRGIEIGFATPMAGGSGTSPALSPDGTVVYVAGGEGTMLAVDTESGKARWRSKGEGLLSPAVGGDGTIYTGDIFGAPTVTALDPADGSVRWAQSYDDYAASVLPELAAAPPRIPSGKPIARLVSVISVSSNAVWVGMAFGYGYVDEGPGRTFTIPHANAVCALSPADGVLISCAPVRDSLEGMLKIDDRGDITVSHTAIFSSMFYYGLGDQLPSRFRVPQAPLGGMTSLGPASPIVPELRRHTEHFRKKVYKVGERVYSAVGWNNSNVVMIEGTDGLILVDTGLSPATSRAVLTEFRKLTDKPIVAIIYSHFHHDHIDGVKGLVDAADVASGRVRIFAHASLMDHLAGESQLLGPILATRTGYTFGFLLGEADRAGMNSGIGPLPIGGRPGSFIPPTDLVEDRLQIEIAGVRLDIVHVPSEAPDELAVYLPDDNILIDTEVLQGPTFPNMHTLRGTRFREPVPWVKSIDRLREFKADYLVPTHGQPVYGAEKVEEVMRMTRDGIQYVHDQTVRQMKKGLTPDELAQTVTLPPHLAEYTPYLREYYGTVKHAVREIYVGYLGWFEGDPVGLDPVPRRERARRTVDMMGGRDKVFAAAEKAHAEGDSQWAAELATLLVRINPEDQPARSLKAAAFRELGYASLNINWRNWYLTSAMELERTLPGGLDKMKNVFLPPDIIAALPPEVALESWGSRLKAEDTLDVNMTLAVEFMDIERSFGLEIRRGVCQFYPQRPPAADIELTLDKPTFDTILLGEHTFASAIAAGKAVLKGSPSELERFLGFFEDPWAEGIDLTVR